MLARVTKIAAAALDKFTVQVVLVPTVTFVAAQVTDDTVGVDQSVMPADFDEAPRVPVIAAVESLVTLPIAALKLWVALPAGTTMLAGTVTKLEFELIVTVVFEAAVCARVTVHTLVVPDISPFGEHANELTSVAAAAS